MKRFFKALSGFILKTAILLVITLPAIYLHNGAPFLVFIAIALITYIIRKGWGFTTLLNNTVLAFCCALIVLCGLYHPLECITQGHSSFGREYTEHLAALTEDTSISYRNGRIAVCNRGIDEAPVIFYMNHEKEIEWAVDLATNPRSVLSRINSLVLIPGWFHDQIKFRGSRLNGTDMLPDMQCHGIAYIWKTNHFQMFIYSTIDTL